jgi:hypothetical protein
MAFFIPSIHFFFGLPRSCFVRVRNTFRWATALLHDDSVEQTKQEQTSNEKLSTANNGLDSFRKDSKQAC